ncbi:MAG: prepilin peptidase [Candidatus Margulisbacteria bacterium]|nr:prepilin peptidase [Candidatus Margulisiibacteriota bacterium]
MVYFWFIIGAVVGSFLNVCIYRLPRNESIVFPASHCPHCGRELSPLELVPIVSYFFLRGKCRSCGAEIAWRYPLVEALTAASFSASWLFVSGSIITFVFQAIFLSVLIVVFFVDLEHQVIPDAVIAVGLIAGLLFNLINGTIVSAVAGLLLCFILLYAIGFFGRAFYKKEVMGEGDLYLGGLLGACLGWPGGLLAIILAYLLAALVSAVFLVRGKVKLGGYIPFGPALSLGGAISLFFGGPLIDWYLRGFWL